MNVGRRTFLCASGASFAGSQAIVGSVTAQSFVTVTIDFESAIGASLEGNEVQFHSLDTHTTEFEHIRDGEIVTPLEADTTYEVTFFKDTPEQFDGVPLVYGIEDRFHVDDEDGHKGTYEIPEGHHVEIQFTDLDGNPAADLPISFRSVKTGSGTGPGGFTTDSSGYVIHPNSAETGVELTDRVGVEIRPRDNFDAGMSADQLLVTEPTEYTIPVRDPDRFAGTSISSGTETSGSTADGPSSSNGDAGGTESPTTGGGGADAHRGFLTNDPDSSLAYLDDPVTLTWAGIIASIIGIFAQLMARQS